MGEFNELAEEVNLEKKQFREPYPNQLTMPLQGPSQWQTILFERLHHPLQHISAN